MGERTHPAAHAPADLNAVARAALALAGRRARFPVAATGDLRRAARSSRSSLNLIVNAAHATGGAAP